MRNFLAIVAVLILAFATTLFANPLQDMTKMISTLLPVVPNSEYATVVVYPDGPEISDEARAKLNEIKTKIAGSLPEVLAHLGALATSKDQTHVALTKISASLKEVLKAELIELQKHLGSEFVALNIYFLPIRVDIAKQGKVVVDPRFGLPEITYRATGTSEKELFYQLFASFRETVNAAIAIQAERANQKFLPVGGAITLQVDRKNAFLSLQGMGVVAPMVSEFKRENEMVRIATMHVPKGLQADSTVSLLTIAQNLNSEAPASIMVELGGYQGINGKSRRLQISEGQATSGVSSCEVITRSLPFLDGILAHNAHDNKLVSKVLLGKPVRFFIKSLEINSETLKVQRIDMRTSIYKLPGGTCLQLDLVSSQFQNEVNLAIKGLFESVQVDEKLKEELLDQLYK